MSDKVRPGAEEFRLDIHLESKTAFKEQLEQLCMNWEQKLLTCNGSYYTWNNDRNDKQKLEFGSPRQPNNA